MNMGNIIALIKSLGGGGGVQPDWNQNDSTAADYVKNRPFYTGDPVETVLLEETTAQFFDTGEGIYAAQIKSTIPFTVGKTYKISWDGTAYERVCTEFQEVPFIGNLSIMGVGSDTGEPFIILTNTNVDNGVTAIYTPDTASSHTISLSVRAVQVVKIDKKYLPDTVATKSDVEIAQTTADTAKTTADSAKTIAETAKIDPVKYNYSANLFSKHGEFLGWYIVMPKLGYNQTVGKFYRSPWETDSIKLEDIPFDDFICVEYLKFPGLPNMLYRMFFRIHNVAGSNLMSVSGLAISEKGNMFYVKTNEVDKSTGEGIFFELLMPEYMMINSSTSGSTKKFKITVDDSGSISATEVT